MKVGTRVMIRFPEHSGPGTITHRRPPFRWVEVLPDNLNDFGLCGRVPNRVSMLCRPHELELIP